MEARSVPALTIAYSPKQIDIEADIVFVGGVYGPSPLSDSWLDSKTHVHWPSQLLPTDVPFARVLMYDYDADMETFFAATGDNNLEWHAKNLLFDLTRIRADSHTEDRLIIFVAHGIGGLIIKQSIGIAKNGAIPMVAQLTVGIFFFGTRHRESDIAGWPSSGSKFARSGGLIEDRTINETTSASCSLDRVSSGFHKLLDFRTRMNTEIYIETFYEELPTPGIGFVVSRHDAALPGYHSNGIYASHADLARYSHEDDPVYRMITASIRRLFGRIIEPGIEECREAYLQSLYFEEIFDWQKHIDDRTPQTEDWVFSQSDFDFTNWIAEGGEPIWIHGRPGCGKSTLMKCLATSQRVTGLLVNESASSRRVATDAAFSVAYFFNGDHKTLQSSLIGMLRSLIWQILRQQPAVFDPSFLLPETQHRYALKTSWRASELFEVLQTILTLDVLRPVCVFIGALDKLEDSGQEDLTAHVAHMLKELAAKMSRSCRLIFSSRVEPLFWSTFASYRQINLSWYRTGSLPSELSYLYEEMFRERDISKDSEFMRMLAAVIYAVRPLSMQEMCVVVDAWDPEWAIERKVSSERQENLEQKLLYLSQGLLDVQTGLVEFVPRSAREHVKNFLLPRFDNAAPDGEMIILRACLLYLQHMHEEMERHCHDTDFELSDAGNALVEDSPFLHYAVTFWVLHGIRLQRKVGPHVFEMEIQRMHRSHFKTWKSYFISARESSEGDPAQQEVERYFLARACAVNTPLEFVSQFNTQVGSHLWGEGAHSWDSTYESELSLGALLDKRPSRVSPRLSPTSLQDLSIIPIMSDSRLISLFEDMKETFWQERRHLQQDEIKLQWVANVAPLISIHHKPEALAQLLEAISTQGQQMAHQSTSKSWEKASRYIPGTITPLEPSQYYDIPSKELISRGRSRTLQYNTETTAEDTFDTPLFDIISWQLDSTPYSGYINPSISSPFFTARRTEDYVHQTRVFSSFKTCPPKRLQTNVRSADPEIGAIELGLDQQESDTEPPRSQGPVAGRLDKLDYQPVEDCSNPILLEQESALGLDSSEASKIKEVLLALFINDDDLRSVCKTALENMSPDKFERNLQEHLRLFANDLKEEAHEVHEYNISYFCDSDRKHIARYIRTLFTNENSVSKKPNNVNQLERFLSGSKAFVTMRTTIKKFGEPRTSFNSSDPNRQVSAAVSTEERSPMLEEATNVPSNTSQHGETLDIRQVQESRLLFVGSTNPQLLDPPIALNRSLLFRSYRYIIGQVLGFLQGLNLYEPPLPANYVRLQWICVCGNLFFRDFVLSEVSSAYGLRDLLLHSGYQAALYVNPCIFQAAAQGCDVLREPSATSVNNQSTQPRLSSGHTAKPSNPNQNLGGKVVTPDDPSEVLERDNGLKAMWIIICFYYNRHVSQAVHLDTQVGDDDVSLIKNARQKRFEKRGWFAYYMSWKAVTKIAFVKFGYILDPIIEEGLALLHEDWVPPEDWKDTKFWEPCPAEPRPIAEQRFLLHLWDHPHNSRPYLIIQTTKLRMIEQAKSLLKRWRIQKKNCSGWLKEPRDQYKRFRGWNTSSEQLPFSNPNNLQRIDDPCDSAQRATGKGRYLFKSTPKRLEKELQAHLDEPPLGWGLHFEESIVVPAPLRYLGIFIVIAMILSAVVSALVLVHEKGVAYFGMGSFGIGIAAIGMTLVLRLIAV